MEQGLLSTNTKGCLILPCCFGQSRLEMPWSSIRVLPPPPFRQCPPCPYAPRIQINTSDYTPDSVAPQIHVSSSSSHDRILNQPSVPHAREGNARHRSRSLAPLELQISRGKAQEPELVNGLLLVVLGCLERRSLELGPRVGRDGDQQLETKPSALWHGVGGRAARRTLSIASIRAWRTPSLIMATSSSSTG